MQKKKNVPAFLRNTYEMLEREDLGNVVSWAESGSGFVIKDLETFSTQILPQYFKHKKYTSFVRQLNMYGFHKQRHQLSNYHYFAHQYFRRGDSESKAQDTKLLLAAIKRKPEKKKKLSEGQEQQEQPQANPCTEEVESSSQRSVSMVLEEEKPKEEREKSEEMERQENEEEWSEGSSEQVDQITEKVMEQNEILRNLHGLIRAEVLNAKKRSIERLTSIDLATNAKEEEPIAKLTQLLTEGAHLIGKLSESYEQQEH